MKKIVACVALLWVATFNTVRGALPIYADGDLAPLGAPDGMINSADYLILNRIVLDQIVPGELEYSHGDVYPVGNPDGVLNIQDLLLIQNMVLNGEGVSNYIETLDLFYDGPATVGANGATTTLIVDGWTGSGASVINDPAFTDPADATNTVWRISVSGGAANAFLRTGNLSADPVLDSGFDLSGNGNGKLVFDIKVISVTPGATFTVKIDSGYPALGQAALSSSQYTFGDWKRVSIDFATLLADPGPGPGLDLSNVLNAFVIEVTGGDAEFYIDNLFISHACGDVDNCNATVNTKPEYQLVWSDEFDGTTLSTDNWYLETGYGSNGWGNDEWQLYTSSSNNVFVANGNLNIHANCASPPACGKRDGSITSSRINTLNKFSFKYGKVEARLKPPVGKGAWPAFWMLGANFPNVGWPRSGEIDVMEIHNRYSNDRTTHFTMHYCNDYVSANPCQYDPGWDYVSQYLAFASSLGDDFHVFSAEWSEDAIVGKIDGIQYFTVSIDPNNMEEFLEEFFMLLNVAIGGTLGGSPDATTVWPQVMQVDYVRVYQEAGVGTYTVGPPPATPEKGIYSESHTASTLSYTNIINGADFGGNVTNTNESSNAVTPLDGVNVLQADYLNTGKFYGGFIFNFNNARDISAYQSLKFAVDSSQLATFANLEVKFEDSDSGSETGVQISNYVPTVSGNWVIYEIPLSDFVNFDPTAANLLGFWNARNIGGSLIYGTLYFDDIHLSGGM